MADVTSDVPMQAEPLIVEDLVLLLLPDDGSTVAGAGTLYYTLAGAVLTELGLLGRVDTVEGSWLTGSKVVVTGDGPLPDPVLQNAYDEIARRPQSVHALLATIGADLWEPVTDRLVARGLVRREERKFLGLFRTTRLPAQDTGHEAALRERVRAVLEDGVEPDARTAAVTALLSASGTLPQMHPVPRWSGDVYRRGKELEQGNWGAAALGEAVTRTAAAIATASVASAVAVSGTTT